MYRTIQFILVGIFAVIFGASAIARRFPNVAWLQVLRYDPPRLSVEQRARNRRRANVYAGVEMILMGVVLPFGYFALTVMFFNSPTPTGIVLTLGASLLLIVLGVVSIARSRQG